MPGSAGAHLGGALNVFTPDFHALLGPVDWTLWSRPSRRLLQPARETAVFITWRELPETGQDSAVWSVIPSFGGGCFLYV